MVKGLLGVAGFVALCIVAFNYVEAHNSTKIKSELARLETKVANFRTEISDLNKARVNLDGQLRQACGLLEEHDIESNLCTKWEEPVEDSDDERSGENDGS